MNRRKFMCGGRHEDHIAFREAQNWSRAGLAVHEEGVASHRDLRHPRLFLASNF